MLNLTQALPVKVRRLLSGVALIGCASMTNADSVFEKIVPPEARAEEARNAVKAILKDPESAQFRNLYTKSIGGKLVGSVVVCGEVNAKNSYGGYIGFTRFYQAKPGEAATLWSTESWENSSFGFLCD